MRTCLVLLVCGLVFYQANGRPHPEQDCVAAPYVAWSIVTSGTTDLSLYPELKSLPATQIQHLPDGRMLSVRPPGSALPIIPLVAPIAWLGCDVPRPATMLFLGKVASSLCVAGSMVLIFLMCRRLTPRGALPAAILFGFGTIVASVASQASWTHGPATLWLTVALYAAFHPRASSNSMTALHGAGLGLAVLSRSSTALFALASGLALLQQRRLKQAFILTAVGAIPVVWLVVMNWIQFGSPILGGYAKDNWGKHTPILFGIAGLTVAPSRGIFVYSPALLLLLPGLLRWVAARQRGEAAPSPTWDRTTFGYWMVAAFGTLVFFARWHDWAGGWSFGPRLMCETMPILCVGFAVCYDHLHSWVGRRCADALVAASVLVQIGGIYGHGAHVEWHSRHIYAVDNGASMFDVRDTEIAAHWESIIDHFLPEETADATVLAGRITERK